MNELEMKIEELEGAIEKLYAIAYGEHGELIDEGAHKEIDILEEELSKWENRLKNPILKDLWRVG